MPKTYASLIWRSLAGAGLLALACGALAAYWLAARVPRAPEPAGTTTAPRVAWPVSHAPDASVWNVLQPAPSAARIAGPLAGRFRLAGTFFLHPGIGEGTGSVRKAILDDLRGGHQLLLAEGDAVDGVKAVEILDDHVRLREGAAEETIWLSFLSPTGGALAASAAETLPASEGGLEPVALETNRFGRRVGMNRWVIQRDELVKYYQELLDDPERIAALYVSLKPDYKENAISGYQLDVAGEGDFFKAIGMQPGDTIRKVNSMNMTSQKRAEYFIGEFMKNRISAFVLDLEREGKPEKLIYLLR